MIGNKIIDGKQAAAEMLQTITTEASELIVDDIISHGDRCAADGTLIYADGSKVAFCDMYVFTSHGKGAKLKSISSYVIDL